jgi:hypothetical protein
MAFIKIRIINETTPACSVLLSEAQLLRRGRIIPEIGERGKDSGKLRDIFVQQVCKAPAGNYSFVTFGGLI